MFEYSIYYKIYLKKVKNEINTIISNQKVCLSSLKISLYTIKSFFRLTIDNKYINNTSIL